MVRGLKLEYIQKMKLKNVILEKIMREVAEKQYHRKNTKQLKKVEELQENMLKLKDVTDEVDRLRCYIEEMEASAGPQTSE